MTGLDFLNHTGELIGRAITQTTGSLWVSDQVDEISLRMGEAGTAM